MSAGLACQTQETPDARDLYAVAAADCEGCRLDGALAGAPAAVIDEDRPAELVSLARWALGSGERGQPRAIAPRERTDKAGQQG